MVTKIVLKVLLLSIVLFVADAQMMTRASNLAFNKNNGKVSNTALVGKWTTTQIAGYKTNIDI